MASEKKMISIPYEGYKGRNRDYCSHFLVTFETTGKFLIVFVRLILGKVRVDGYTGLRWESDIRYEFELKSWFYLFYLIRYLESIKRIIHRLSYID